MDGHVTFDPRELDMENIAPSARAPLKGIKGWNAVLKLGPMLISIESYVGGSSE